MTELLHLQDSYQRECEAVVSYAESTNIVVDETVLYPQGGGVPSDTGQITRKSDGEIFKITLVKKRDGHIVHELDKPGLKVGDAVVVSVDWDRRYKLMRMHTACHVLSAVGFKELGLLVTGNQLDLEKSRMDFNLEKCDREAIQDIVDKANVLIQHGAAVTVTYMDREEALKIPSLVRLANVLPPDIKIWRIVSIEGIDQQADGGAHVKDAKEIGTINFLSIDNKGKNNRRLYFTLEQ